MQDEQEASLPSLVCLLEWRALGRLQCWLFSLVTGQQHRSHSASRHPVKSAPSTSHAGPLPVKGSLCAYTSCCVLLGLQTVESQDIAKILYTSV